MLSYISFLKKCHSKVNDICLWLFLNYWYYFKESSEISLLLCCCNGSLKRNYKMTCNKLLLNCHFPNCCNKPITWKCNLNILNTFSSWVKLKACEFGFLVCSALVPFFLHYRTEWNCINQNDIYFMFYCSSFIHLQMHNYKSIPQEHVILLEL